MSKNRNKNLSAAEKELAELTAKPPVIEPESVEEKVEDPVDQEENAQQEAPPEPEGGVTEDSSEEPEDETPVEEESEGESEELPKEEDDEEVPDPEPPEEEIGEQPPQDKEPEEDPVETAEEAVEEVVEQACCIDNIYESLECVLDHRFIPSEEKLKHLVSVTLEYEHDIDSSGFGGGFAAMLRRLYSFVRSDSDATPDHVILHWAKTGEPAAYVRPGIMYSDVLRKKKSIENLTDEEVGLIFLEKIEETDTVDALAAMKEIIRRQSFHPDTPDVMVKDFLVNGVVPKVTLAMLDIFKLKPARYWSDEEIRLFAIGEINATEVATASNIYDEYRRRNEVSKNNFNDQRIQTILSESEKVKKPMSQTILEAELKKYAEEMAPSSTVTEVKAGAQQASLNRQLRRTIKLPANEFEQAWTTILDWFHQNRETLFTEKRALRGLSESGLYGRDLYTFEQLLTLCVRTADPSVRYNMNKNINFGAVLEKITDESIRQKVLSYYRVGQ